MSTPINIPVSLSLAQMFTSLAAMPGQKSTFRLKIEARMGQMEGMVNVPKTAVVVLDYSPSMYWDWQGADRMRVAKDGIVELIDGFNPEDQIAIVLLDKNASIALPFTRCDKNGKDRAEHIVRSVGSGDGTNYCPALGTAFDLFSNVTSARTKKLVFFNTDGQSFDEYNNPVGLCDEARKQGISIYAAAIGMEPEHRDLVMKISNNQFAPCDTPVALLEFFRGVDAQVSMAGVTNAKLVLDPTSMATIQRFHGATKGDAGNYIKPDNTGKVVVLGDLAPGDDFACYCQLQVALPPDIDKDLKPPTSKPAIRKAFGFVRVVGDVPSAGLQNYTIKEEPIVVKFALQSSAGPNEDVVTFTQVASSVYELAAGNVAGAAKAMENAAQTVAFSKDRIAQAMARRVKAMGGMSAEEKQAAAQGATVAFDPKRIAAAKARRAQK